MPSSDAENFLKEFESWAQYSGINDARKYGALQFAFRNNVNSTWLTLSQKKADNWANWRTLFKKTFITEVSPSEVVHLFRDLTMKEGDAVALFHSKVEIAMSGMDDTLPTRNNDYYDAIADHKTAYETGLETYKTAFRRIFWQLGITKSFTSVIAKLPKNATEDQIVNAAVAHERETLEV